MNSKQKAKVISDEKRWRIEEDARIMKRMMQMQKEPKRLQEAQNLIKQELQDLALITGHKVVNKKVPQNQIKKRG